MKGVGLVPVLWMYLTQNQDLLAYVEIKQGLILRCRNIFRVGQVEIKFQGGGWRIKQLTQEMMLVMLIDRIPWVRGTFHFLSVVLFNNVR